MRQTITRTGTDACRPNQATHPVPARKRPLRFRAGILSALAAALAFAAAGLARPEPAAAQTPPTPPTIVVEEIIVGVGPQGLLTREGHRIPLSGSPPPAIRWPQGREWPGGLAGNLPLSVRLSYRKPNKLLPPGEHPSLLQVEVIERFRGAHGD